MISSEKVAAQEKRMEALGIREDEIVEKFIHGSGSGGQKINKTASCVYLKHEPTGIEIKCQRERSRAGRHTDAKKTPSRRDSGRTSGARDEPLVADVGEQRVCD